MSRNRVYWSFSNESGTGFFPRIEAPDVDSRGGEDQNYPLVVSNRKGEVLLVWKQGTRVCWGRFDRRGKFSGQSGTVGELGSHSKPSAFVDNKDRFRIVM